jgi:hypothetical protein
MGKRGEQGPPEEPTDKDAASHSGRVRKPFPVHEHVGRRLKEMFDEVTTQPIPDKFVKLLEELEHRQSGETLAPGLTKPTSKRKPRKSK